MCPWAPQKELATLALIITVVSFISSVFCFDDGGSAWNQTLHRWSKPSTTELPLMHSYEKTPIYILSSVYPLMYV